MSEQLAAFAGDSGKDGAQIFVNRAFSSLSDSVFGKEGEDPTWTRRKQIQDDYAHRFQTAQQIADISSRLQMSPSTYLHGGGGGGATSPIMAGQSNYGSRAKDIAYQRVQASQQRESEARIELLKAQAKKLNESPASGTGVGEDQAATIPEPLANKTVNDPVGGNFKISPGTQAKDIEDQYSGAAAEIHGFPRYIKDRWGITPTQAVGILLGTAASLVVLKKLPPQAIKALRKYRIQKLKDGSWKFLPGKVTPNLRKSPAGRWQKPASRPTSVRG